jgi:hypothetical protein
MGPIQVYFARALRFIDHFQSIMETMKMGITAEHRRNPRIDVPVQIDLPRLAPGETLEAKDISMGGFMFEVDTRPVVGAESLCEISFKDKMFRGEAVIVWARENIDPSGPGWRAGLSFKMNEVSRMVSPG